MRVVAGIKGFCTLGQPVERRYGKEQMAAPDQVRHFLVEEGDQQRRNVGAVDIGVGHDDDALVAQILVAIFRTRCAAEGLDQVGDLLVGRELFAGGAADVQDLAAQRKNSLVGAVPGLLGRTAGRIAFDDEEFGTGSRILRAVGQLARQPQLADRGLAVDLFFLAATQPLFGAFDHPVEQLF